MSIKVMSHVWDNSKQKGTALLILLALADFSNEEGECYPGTTRLAKKARISTVTLHKYLADMEASREIGIIQGKGISVNGGTTNRYYLNEYRLTHELKAIHTDTHKSNPVNTGLQPSDDDTPINTPLQPPVNPYLQGVVNTPLEGVVNTGLHKPSVEPSLEPSVSKAPRKRTTKQQANDEANALKIAPLEKALGIPAAMPDVPLYLKIVNDLISGGVPETEFGDYVKRIRRIAKEQNWTVTTPSLTANGRISEYVTARDTYRKTKAQQVANGNGNHTAYDPYQQQGLTLEELTHAKP